MNLTPKQKAFAENYIIYGNATEAAKKAGSQSQRKDTNRAVRDVCRDNGFGRCLLKDEFRSNREFNSAVIEYDRLSYDVTVENKIIIELSQFLATYPTQQKEAGSYITDYLKKRGDRKTMERFDLFPFSVSVQALERTFVDKVFGSTANKKTNGYAQRSRSFFIKLIVIFVFSARIPFTSTV